MTDPAQEEIVTQEPAPQEAPVGDVEIIEAPEEEIEQPEPEEPKKQDRVEFSTPEQQAKFNDVYKQMKMSDQRNAMLTDILTEQQRQLDELRARNLQSDSANAEQMLMAKIKAARETGNEDAEFKAIGELADFRAEQKIRKVNATQQQAQQQTAQLETREAQYVDSLMRETDASGNLIRPWLNPQGPDFNNTINQLQTIAKKYYGDPFALQKSMAELDVIMSQKKEPPKPHVTTNTRAPNPMAGGNLTNGNPRGTIKMTRAEMDIINKLNAGLPEGRKIDPKKYAARRDAQNAKGSRK